MDVLRRSYAQVEVMIDEGKIAFAFDLRANGQKKFIYLYWPCVLDVRNGTAFVNASDWQGVAQNLCGPTTVVSMIYLARRLNLDIEHFKNLQRSERWRITKAAAKSGPHSSPRIEVALVREFLRQRRIF
jgi:hypothetical protein